MAHDPRHARHGYMCPAHVNFHTITNALILPVFALKIVIKKNP
jgi:hypothetical protein